MDQQLASWRFRAWINSFIRELNEGYMIKSPSRHAERPTTSEKGLLSLHPFFPAKHIVRVTTSPWPSTFPWPDGVGPSPEPGGAW